MSSFGTQEFHRNHTGISQESVQFHKKNVGTGKKSRNPEEPYTVKTHADCKYPVKITEYSRAMLINYTMKRRFEILKLRLTIFSQQQNIPLLEFMCFI
jgi:hypothetical protein